MISLTPTVGFTLHDVARLMRKRFEQRARHLGLTRSQWQALVHIAHKPGIQQSVLADTLEVEPITLCRIVDRLEASGFVERRRHATDRRLWLLHVTDQADPLLSQMTELADLNREEALAGVSVEHQELLLSILSTMRANLIQACAKPAPLPAQEQAAEITKETAEANG